MGLLLETLGFCGVELQVLYRQFLDFFQFYLFFHPFSSAYSYLDHGGLEPIPATVG